MNGAGNILVNHLNTTGMGLGMFLLALFFSANSWAEGLVNQKPIAQSADKRFANYADGTTLDKKTGLLWMTQDYWQRKPIGSTGTRQTNMPSA